MKTVMIGIARMGSTRFPGKVLAPLCDWSVIDWVVAAGDVAPGVDDVCIATSTLPQDDVIASHCEAKGMPCFRGDETDVLSRFAGAARFMNADIAIRVTCDCPFLDPEVIGGVVALLKRSGASYVSNIDPPTWPDGLDCEAFKVDALYAADREATRPTDRNCVTQYILRNRDRWPAEAFICPIPGLEKERWVLDTMDDYRFCEEIASRLEEPIYRRPSYLDILQILERAPHLRKINAHHPRNERFYDELATEEMPEPKFSRSQALFARASKTIPFSAQTFSKSHLQYPKGAAPLFLTHGDGGRVFDVDGNDYVDLVGALLPNVLGYRDPDVDAAIRRQLSAGISFSLATKLEAELAERLVKHIPCAEMVKFGKSGTDVTTAAVRVARGFTGRDDVLICGGYHGWADWTTERCVGVPTRVQDCTMRIAGEDLDRAPSMIRTGRYAAVIVEPERNGEYLRALRSACNESGTILIFDEVITGFRWALGGAQEVFNVTPDLACFAKAMANGMPISAVVGRADIMKRFAPGDEPNVFYSGTMFGETLSLAAAIATIDKMEREPVIRKLHETGEEMARPFTTMIVEKGLLDQIQPYGQGCLVRFRFRDHPTATGEQIRALFMKEMIRNGVLIISSQNVCYAHNKSDIARVIRAYEAASWTVGDALQRGNVRELIEHTPIVALPRGQTSA